MAAVGIRWIVWMLVCSLMVTSCQKDPSPFIIDNLNGNSISVFGHAGMGIYFRHPINSYESIENCMQIGADGSEIDIQLTKDNVLIAFHGGQLEELTNMSGLVNDKTWEELQTGAYSSLFSSKTRLQTVDHLIASFHDNRRIFTFDCRLQAGNGTDNDTYLQSYATALTALIHKYNLEEFCFIENNDERFLTLVRQLNPRLRLFYYANQFEDGLEVTNRLDLYGMTIKNDHITEAQVTVAHQHNRRIALFGLHTSDENVDAIIKSPDYIQTDRLTHLLKVFDLYKHQGWNSLQW